jgi:hypothetical protein
MMTAFIAHQNVVDDKLLTIVAEALNEWFSPEASGENHPLRASAKMTSNLSSTTF